MTPTARTPIGAVLERCRRLLAASEPRPSATEARISPYHAAAFTRTAPHVRDAMSLERMRALQVAALVPALVVGLWNVGRQVATAPQPAVGAPATDPWAAGWALLLGLRVFLPVFAVALVAGGACLGLFAWGRGRAASGNLLLAALLFALALPPSIPLGKVAVGMVFGLAIGQEVFGGPGRNFLNPALVGIVFLYFAYPDALRAAGVSVPVDGGAPALAAGGPTWWQSLLGAQRGAFGDTSALACLLGAALLCQRRLIAWRILAGGVSGLVLTLFVIRLVAGGTLPLAAVAWYWHLTLGSFAFALVFLATDPVTTPTTAGGRWIYGLLIGAVTMLVRLANPAHGEGVMLAILLGNTAAPLIDHFAVRRHVRRSLHRAVRRDA